MSLAKRGIAFGRKCAATELLGNDTVDVVRSNSQCSDGVFPDCTGSGDLKGHPKLDTFSEHVFKQTGFLRTAYEVLANGYVELESAELLLKRASLPILCRLNSLRRLRSVGEGIAPITLVDLDKIYQSTADYDAVTVDVRSRLEAFTHESFMGVFDGLRLEHLDLGLLDCLFEISCLAGGVELIGPRIMEIARWIEEDRQGSIAAGQHKHLLEEMLCLFKDLGFTQLGECCESFELQLSRSYGFRSVVVSDVSGVDSLRDLCAELRRVADLTANLASSDTGEVDFWCPVLRNTVTAGEDPALANLRLLRFMAVGSLCLPRVRCVRAPLEHLTPDLLKLARECGANDFGYAAIDHESAARLNIPLYNAVATELRLEPLQEARAG